MHDLTLISTIAAGFAAAWVLGLLAQWLKLSPIVGYLLAGVLIGPHSPGFKGDVGIATQLAELGVILLMFGVGLHFHLKDLLAVRRVAVPGAVVQSAIATGAAMVLFHGFGMSWSTGAVIGMAMAVASTVVLMRVLMDSNSLSSPEGHVAVGWLIVEDIFTVILLVLIPVFGDWNKPDAGGAGGLWWTLGVALVKLVVMVMVVLWAGSRIIPRVLVRVAGLRSRELFTLTVLVFSIAVAAASYFFFGASMALGAFLAGMVVAQSPVSSQAAADALPLRDAFAVLFFVAVGMLFDPRFLVEHPLMVLAALGVILLAKPLAAILIVALLGYSARTALTVAVGLAQIGEFSFILSDLARQHGLMPDEGHHVLVAAAILSITLNPLLFRQLPGIEQWLRGKPLLWKWLNGRAERRAARMMPEDAAGEGEVGSDSLDAFAIVAGYGPVGRSVRRVLEEAGIPAVVVDLNMDAIIELRGEGHRAIFGDASNERILEQAGVARASHLVVTVPDASQRAAIITAGRSLNKDLKIVVRARYLRERDELEQGGVSGAVYEEAEAAVALARLVLAGTGVHRDAVRIKLEEIRFQLALESFPDLRRLKVGTVMIPWTKVRTVPGGLERAEARERMVASGHEVLPVVGVGGVPLGAVWVEQFLSDPRKGDWSELVRPLLAAKPEETVGEVFERMCEAKERICLIREGGATLGIVTRGHLLDRVERHFARAQTVRAVTTDLEEAVKRGGVVPQLESTTREEAIREMARVIPESVLPDGVNADILLNRVFAREAEVSTDLGNGVALPHARCDNLEEPLVVIGRSPEGIAFSDEGLCAVRIFFLLVTPTERPETHLALLGQIARLVGKDERRAALMEALTPVDVMELLADAGQTASR